MNAKEVRALRRRLKKLSQKDLIEQIITRAGQDCAIAANRVLDEQKVARFRDEVNARNGEIEALKRDLAGRDVEIERLKLERKELHDKNTAVLAEKDSTHAEVVRLGKLVIDLQSERARADQDIAEMQRQKIAGAEFSARREKFLISQADAMREHALGYVASLEGE